MKRRDVSGALTALTGFLSRASNQIATVIVTLVATRYLDPTEFGVFALGSIAATLIRTFLYSGAFEYLLRAPDARDCSTESLAVNLLLAVALSALIGVATLVGSHLFAAGAVAAILLALLPSNLIAAVSAWREALLLRSVRLRLYYGLTTLAELIAMAVAIGLLVAGFKVGALVWQVYARNLGTLIFYFLTGRGTLSARFSWARFRQVLNWSVSRYAAVLVGFGANYGADICLGIFLSPAATGLYRAGSRIVTGVSDLFSQPARTIAMTLFSARSARGERSDMLWPNVFVVAAGIGWSALAGLAVVASSLVPLALGDQWRAAAALVPILCVARAFAMFDGIVGAVLVASNEQRPLFYVQCVTAAITLLLIVAAAPFGLVPATVAVAGGALVASFILANLVFRRLPGSGGVLLRALPALAVPVAATVAGALAGRLIAAAWNAVPATVLATSCGIAAWGIALLLIRRRARTIVATLNAGASPMPA